MKRLITTTIAIMVLAASAVFAERIDIGGYFSVDIPAAWRVKSTGRNLHDDGTYSIHEAYGKVASVTIKVRNNDPNAVTLADFHSMTAADLEQLAVYNHRSGWSKPTIRKDTINGIPALIENAIITHGNRRSVGMTLWLGGKTFQVRLIYERIPGLVDHVNKTIESIRVGPLALQAIPENQGSTEAAVDQAYRQGYIDGSQLRAEGASL